MRTAESSKEEKIRKMMSYNRGATTQDGALLKRRKEINNKLSINHKSNLNNGATKGRQERGEAKQRQGDTI